MKKLLALMLILVFIIGVLSGCGKSNKKGTVGEDSNNVGSTEKSEPIKVDFSQTDADMFTERDLKFGYDGEKSISIKLNGNSATASSESVKISGTTITITENATHIISGTLDDGMIIVDAPQDAKLQLVFDGVNINSKTSAALYIRKADKVFITLAKDSENVLSNGGTFTAIDDNNIDAALFSKQDLTVNGEGKLTVTSPIGHGIVCKDDLVVTGGSYNISAASHTIDANNSVRIMNAAITADAGKDGIHAENTDDASLGFVYISSGTIKIEAEGDGIGAGGYMQIENGSIDVLAGGGSQNGSKSSSQFYGGFMGGGRGGKGFEPQPQTTDESSTSMKGIKAVNSMLVSGGTITVNSADDSIHSDASVTINGGSFKITSGDDAIHAEEKLTVTSGEIDITESYEGLEALDIEIKGGDIKLVARDDGLNAAGGADSSGFTGGRDGMFGTGPGGMGGGMSASSNGSIVISGGKLYVNASGDGIDANGTLEISGGYTVVVGPTQGDTATLDYDVSAVISGGTFIGTGASGMAQTFSDSKQGVLAVSVGNQSAGTAITVKDKNGKTIISHTPELSFAVVIISSADIVSGESYNITVGSNSAQFEAS